MRATPRLLLLLLAASVIWSSQPLRGTTSSIVFSYSGSVETWTVPAGVTSIRVDLRGGQGGNAAQYYASPGGTGGLGGRIETDLPVVPGEQLFISVGGSGLGGAAGFNGGGPGGSGGGVGGSGGAGGGASDIRRAPGTLADRLAVAGGGGGGAGYCGAVGAAGGGAVAESGIDCGAATGGGGGSQVSGGTGGTIGSFYSQPGSPGGLGIGGKGGNYNASGVGGGGGGGGYFGGGGGGSDSGGGGGGSSFSNGQNTVHEPGFQSGPGSITISFSATTDDDDDDGVEDALDQCHGTPGGRPVLSTGCELPLSGSNVLVGTAVRQQPYTPGTSASDPAYRQLLVEQFNLATPENELKMYALELPGGVQKALAFVDTLAADGLTVRGHALVWHNKEVGDEPSDATCFASGQCDQVPQRVLQIRQTAGTKGNPVGRVRAELRGVFDDHVRRTVATFGSKVRYWDVVNEALSRELLPSASLDWREFAKENVWHFAMGSEYIARAFALAHSELQKHHIRDSVDLFYNEILGDDNYQLFPMGNTNKATALWLMLEELGAEGHIDGVGLQMHESLENLQLQAGGVALNDYLRGDFRNTLQSYLQALANLGLDVHVTELDVRSNPGFADARDVSAVVYEVVASACRAVTQCKAVTVWGFTERETWIPGAFPGQQPLLLYDNAYGPTKSYGGLYRGLGLQ